MALAVGLVGCVPRAVGRLPAPQAVHAPVEGRAGEVLIRGTADLDISVRARSLAWLIRLDPAPGGGTWTPRALHDPAPFVQQLAVEALASRIQEEEARRALADLVRRDRVDPYVRGQAALRLAWAGDSRAAADTAAAWRAQRDAWDVAPLALAAAVLGDPEAVVALSRALEEGAFPLETGFFLDIGGSGLVGLVPALETAGGLVEEELQLPLAVTRAALGDRGGVRAVRKVLRGQDAAFQLDALDYLSDVRGPMGARLVRSTRPHRDPTVRAFRRLARVAQGSRRVSAAERAWRSEDREVRARALEAVAQALRWTELSGPEARVARRMANEGLSDEEYVVQLQALRCLAVAGRREDLQAAAQGGAAGEGRGGEPALLLLLEDESPLVRIEAAAAILSLSAR